MVSVDTFIWWLGAGRPATSEAMGATTGGWALPQATTAPWPMGLPMLPIRWPGARASLVHQQSWQPSPFSSQAGGPTSMTNGGERGQKAETLVS